MEIIRNAERVYYECGQYKVCVRCHLTCTESIMRNLYSLVLTRTSSHILSLHQSITCCICGENINFHQKQVTQVWLDKEHCLIGINSPIMMQKLKLQHTLNLADNQTTESINEQLVAQTKNYIDQLIKTKEKKKSTVIAKARTQKREKVVTTTETQNGEETATSAEINELLEFIAIEVPQEQLDAIMATLDNETELLCLEQLT